MKTRTIFLSILIAGVLLGVNIGVSAADRPFVILVNSTADALVAGDKQCTLREAISNANANGELTAGDCRPGIGADIIVLSTGHYNLAIPGAGEDGNASGDLDVTDSLTIYGAGPEVTIIHGNNLDRVFHILGTQTAVLLHNLKIAGGYSTQGFVQGGGGILNEFATLEVQKSAVSDNVVSGYSFANGGGIYNFDGRLTISETLVSGNVALSDDASGGGVANSTWQSSGLVNIVDSQLIGNSAGVGGGLSSSTGGSPATITVQRSTIYRNEALGDEAYTGLGGGAFLSGANVLIDSSTIAGNNVSGNSEYSGAGAGLFLQDSSSTVVNSTISSNAALGNETIPTSGGGAGLLLQGLYAPSNTTLINTTVAHNVSNVAGGGLASASTRSVVKVFFSNTLMADNMAPVGANCSDLGGEIDAPLYWFSLGHNLESWDTCNFNQRTDQVNTDPRIEQLRDNGGPTWTHALLNGSPAIDAGNDGVCLAGFVKGVDQRGVARPIGPHCDIGAYESEAKPPAGDPDSDS